MRGGDEGMDTCFLMSERGKTVHGWKWNRSSPTSDCWNTARRPAHGVPSVDRVLGPDRSRIEDAATMGDVSLLHPHRSGGIPIYQRYMRQVVDLAGLSPLDRDWDFFVFCHLNSREGGGGRA